MCLLFLLSTPLIGGVYEGVSFPEKPGQREFIVDTAEMLSTTQESSLRAELDSLLTDKAIPIIIVTITSLRVYDAQALSIEQYARQLYDHWGIGHERLRVKGAGVGRSQDISWNKGILLLISVRDRKARIELGAGFGHTKDYLCRRIMRDNIIALFKRGDFSGGIESGTRALIQMARGEKISAPPRPLWHYALIALFFFLLVWTAISLQQSGSSGWAWFFWGVVFSILGTLLWVLLTHRGSSSSGGFSGGSFGGGFSGGGGATGSW